MSHIQPVGCSPVSGFLYMSDFLHQWLTATQYIAPLMANFDTKLGNDSHIHFMDNGWTFVVSFSLLFLTPVGRLVVILLIFLAPVTVPREFFRVGVMGLLDRRVPASPRSHRPPARDPENSDPVLFMFCFSQERFSWSGGGTSIWTSCTTVGLCRPRSSERFIFLRVGFVLSCLYFRLPSLAIADLQISFRKRYQTRPALLL